MFQLKAIVGLICLGLVTADVRDIANRYQSTNTRFGAAPQSFSSGAFSSNVNGRQTGGTFVANNGQLVQQSFNSNGAPSFTSNNYNGGGNTKSNFMRNSFGTQYSGSKTQHTNTNHNQNTKRNVDTNNNLNEFQCFSAWCQGLNINQLQNKQQPNKLQQKPSLQITPNKQNHNTQNQNQIHFTNQVPQTYFNAFTQNQVPSNHVKTQISTSHNSKFDTFRKFPLSHSSNSLSSGSLTVSRVPCSGAGKVCASKQLCINGVISESKVSSLSSKSNVSKNSITS